VVLHPSIPHHHGAGQLQARVPAAIPPLNLAGTSFRIYDKVDVPQAMVDAREDLKCCGTRFIVVKSNGCG